MTTDTIQVSQRAIDAEFLHDLAGRIFRNAAPQTGFDQGDVDQLYRIERALLAGQSGDWRPIKSAPKDGTPFLGYWRMDEEEVWDDVDLALPPEEAIQITLWGVSDFGHDYWRDNRGYMDGSVPTHWMPLPAAPSADRDERDTLRDIDRLIAACELEFMSDLTETEGDPEDGPWREDDDEAVSHGLAEDGETIVPGNITFGHIRAARSALNRLLPLASTGERDAEVDKE